MLRVRRSIDNKVNESRDESTSNHETDMSSPDAEFPETQVLAVASHVRFVLLRNIYAH